MGNKLEEYENEALTGPAECSLFLFNLRSCAFLLEDSEGFPEYGYKVEHLQEDYVRSRLMVLIRFLNEEDQNPEHIFAINFLREELRQMYQSLLDVDSQGFNLIGFIEHLNTKNILISDDYQYWKECFDQLLFEECSSGGTIFLQESSFNFNAFLVSAICLTSYDELEFYSIVYNFMFEGREVFFTNLLKNRLFETRNKFEEAMYLASLNSRSLGQRIRNKINLLLRSKLLKR